LILIPPIETINEEDKKSRTKKTARGKSIRFREDKQVFTDLNINGTS